MKLNWTKIGATITKKLLYYAVLFVGAMFLFNGSTNLMTMPDTLMNVLGLLLLVATVGSLLTVLLREVLYYVNLFIQKEKSDKQ